MGNNNDLFDLLIETLQNNSNKNIINIGAINNYIDGKDFYNIFYNYIICPLSDNANNITLTNHTYELKNTIGAKTKDNIIEYFIDCYERSDKNCDIKKRINDGYKDILEYNKQIDIKKLKSYLYDKFIILNLIKDFKLQYKYDFIFLKYVLHLKKYFKNQETRLSIIDKLYNSLNINGKLYIQNYTNYKSNTHHTETLNDLERLKYVYDVKYNIFLDNDKTENVIICITKDK